MRYLRRLALPLACSPSSSSPPRALAVAQEKHLIDPTPPGSLNPEPLPPLQNPNAPSTPAKELFALLDHGPIASSECGW